MHFYESSIITTKDGLFCQVYGNVHPTSGILVKPKYIPTTHVENPELPYRFFTGKKMNRLNLWTDKEALRKYIKDFKTAYPSYVFPSPHHDSGRLFFKIPIDNIERIYFPRKGFSELMAMPPGSLDDYLKKVHTLSRLLLESGLKQKDFGITYSTLMGHYNPKISDINFVIYGKAHFWKLMQFLETAKHPLLRWKSDEEWKKFRKGRNRASFFSEEEFLHSMRRKKSEGFFDGSLFVIFAAEKEEETWFKWGHEKYNSLGMVTIKAEVNDSFSSVVRPGFFGVKNTTILQGDNVPINKVAFYSRDYCMLAQPGETIQVCGMLEKVTPKQGEPYHRVVVGYFDAYLDERREKEYIKVIK